MKETLSTAILCVALLGLAAPLAAAAPTPAATGPQRLTASQLDRVTAGGILLGGVSLALASGGSFAIAGTGGAASSNSVSLAGGGSVQSGASLGSASAVGTGGSNSTYANTSGAVGGATLLNVTVGTTLASSTGQISGSMTYVSGGSTFVP